MTNKQLSFNPSKLFAKQTGALSPEQRQEQRNRWLRLLVRITWVQLLLTGVAALFYFSLYLITKEAILLKVSGLVVLHFVFNLIIIGMLQMAKRHFSTRWLEIATFVSVFTWTLDIGLGAALVGTSSGTVAMFFWTPVFIASLGLGVKAVLSAASLSSIAIATSIILQMSHVTTPDLDVVKELPVVNIFFWLITLCMLLAGLLIFRQFLQATLIESNERAQQLAVLSERLQVVAQSAALSSKEMVNFTSELSAASQQQASGSKQQVASVNEVTSSLEELKQNAEQIAFSAHAVANSVHQSSLIANKVKEITTLAQTSTSQGTEAVEAANNSVKRVRERIEMLAQRLLELTEQTGKVTNIIGILDEIADETHLLALNASIEAAGGTNSTDNSNNGYNMRGARFGVVAQEVKNLAERSREATVEVRTALNHMQGAVASAVLVAEEGRKETFNALARSELAGRVIQELNEVCANSALRAEEILASVSEVKTRCEEISLATSQQRSANEQILTTMREVADVSQLNAGAVYQISESVVQVNHRIAQLNSVLAQSFQLSPARA